MPRTQKYFLGPQLLADVRETINRVAAMPESTSGAKIPFIGESASIPTGGATLRYAQTVAEWGKGARQAVQILDSQSTATGETIDAQNPFADVGDAKKVIIASVAGDWFLIAAEC